jgi:hypothetical protein
VQNWWFFAILPNSGGSKYFPHKCGGFLELIICPSNHSLLIALNAVLFSHIIPPFF